MGADLALNLTVAYSSVSHNWGGGGGGPGYPTPIGYSIEQLAKFFDSLIMSLFLYGFSSGDEISRQN